MSNENFIKGNYEIEKLNPIDSQTDDLETIEDLLKEKVLTSLGGSMVYMEKTPLIWKEEKEKE